MNTGNIFESFMQSDYAKAELVRIAIEEGKYPKALPRYGAIFKVEKRPDGTARLAFYLRAGAVVKVPEGEEISGKERIFDYLHKKYPELADTEIHKVIQDIMMQPSTQKHIRKRTGRSPVLAYETVLQLPQIREKSGSEIKEFLIKLLHNGVFDPILSTNKEKTPADIAELDSRLKEVERGETKFYEPKGRGEEGPLELGEFLPSESELKTNSSVKRAQQADTTWWYINEEDMLIEGPFAGIEAAIDAQDRKLGTLEVLEDEILEPKSFEELYEKKLEPEEELIMAAEMKIYFEKLAQLSDKLDAKGETELADQLDKIVKACYDVTPSYDAVKEFHPKGGSPDTRDGHGKVCPGDTRTETITEQQKVDLAVALKKPTGEQPLPTAACKACGLTHIASAVKNCPSCDASL